MQKEVGLARVNWVRMLGGGLIAALIAFITDGQIRSKNGKRTTSASVIMIGICLFVGFGAFAYAQTRSKVAGTVKKETNSMAHASGEFEVKMTPQTADDKSVGAAVGRYS